MNEKLRMAKDMLLSKWGIIYLCFLAVVSVGLIVMVNLNKNAQEEKLSEIESQLQGAEPDESKGEGYVQCLGGSYEIYRPLKFYDSEGNLVVDRDPVLEKLCGEYLTDDIRNQVEKVLYG